eukprot:TRINITY_DN4903_c0_g1_i1.p1 TRINITY_DN4903_c0_g1~~TRINITY_DN4903_c0_g1_i1.p1  ORF type:complete len:243 (-),score=57.69 TRINITY_DN4903_c0_g1_i1:57-740(-)
MEGELDQFRNYSARMAAIDYSVSLEADLFAANNHGNMVRILSGHRRFLGHRRTIRPNKKKIALLMMQREQMTRSEFTLRVQMAQKGFMGDPLENLGLPFFENPQACFCSTLMNASQGASSNSGSLSQSLVVEGRGELRGDKDAAGHDGVREGEGVADDEEKPEETGLEKDNGIAQVMQHEVLHVVVGRKDDNRQYEDVLKNLYSALRCLGHEMISSRSWEHAILRRI